MSNSSTLHLSVGASNVSCEISPIKYVRLDRSWNYADVVSPFTRIYIPTKGEGILSAGGREIRITPGNVYLVPAMLCFSMRCEGKLEKFFTHVSARKENGFDVCSSIQGILSVPERGELDAILSITGNENIEAQIKANALMLSVMMRCITENGCTLGGVEHYSPMVSDALRFIRGALRADLDIDTVAERLFASRHTLQKKFKAELGISIGKYIDELLMIEAERMLCTEGMSIEAISERLGFCDRFYFTRRFAQKYGYSPLRYLKAQRNSAY